ncbi:hypothetical protein K469DRAFT_756078 [Zopfia rhizophila CBS 207.26]|uniref:Chromo domain-containing protein n=1 Tax=Zopfia rhizophila CBS 207.26 TaxID=1314779 RepID=A0A6A6DBF7_9PEZI|nr:hypothetical protein K469DRAFT_756078 [Zopfia rhizophila CBS 207.26]
MSNLHSNAASHETDHPDDNWDEENKNREKDAGEYKPPAPSSVICECHSVSTVNFTSLPFLLPAAPRHIVAEVCLIQGSCQGNAAVIEDSPPKSDTNEGCPREDDIGTQIGDRPEDSSIWTPEGRGEESPTRTKDAIKPEAINRTGTQTTPTHQPQRPVYKKAKEQGKFPLRVNISSSSSSSSNGFDNDTDDDDSVDHTTWLTRKRKRSPPAKRHSQMPNTASKQRRKHAAHSARQQKPSTPRGRPFSSRSSAPQPLSAAQHSGYDTKICYSDESSDDSSEESGDRGRYIGSNKRPMSTARPYRSRRHKQKRNRGGADEDDEYEVEKILDARVNRGKLQYRVEWLGYEDDPK